jgi:hypothetical protein
MSTDVPNNYKEQVKGFSLQVLRRSRRGDEVLNLAKTNLLPRSLRPSLVCGGPRMFSRHPS